MEYKNYYGKCIKTTIIRVVAYWTGIIVHKLPLHNITRLPRKLFCTTSKHLPTL